MAQTANVRLRVELKLRALLGSLDDLAEVAATWDSLSELDQVDFSLQWDHLMADYLTELDEYYWGGEMTPEQQEHYRELLCKLKEALPLIERLNLYRPPVLLEV